MRRRKLVSGMHWKKLNYLMKNFELKLIKNKSFNFSKLVKKLRNYIISFKIINNPILSL